MTFEISEKGEVKLPIARWAEKLWIEKVLVGNPGVSDLLDLWEPTYYTREEAIEKFIDRGAYHNDISQGVLEEVSASEDEVSASEDEGSDVDGFSDEEGNMYFRMEDDYVAEGVDCILDRRTILVWDEERNRFMVRDMLDGENYNENIEPLYIMIDGMMYLRTVDHLGYIVA